MSKPSKDLVPASSEFLVYVADDGSARVQVRLAEGTVWLTQRLMAELYGVAVPTISEHLTGIYETEEVSPTATIRKFRIVRSEGNRSVSRLVDHYALPAIIAVGYRVRSAQGTRFRQWATARLDEFLVQGFVLDDERLKSGTNLGEAPHGAHELEGISQGAHPQGRRLHREELLVRRRASRAESHRHHVPGLCRRPSTTPTDHDHGGLGRQARQLSRVQRAEHTPACRSGQSGKQS